jgi:HlyD family secretion protein/epimerase transport system membrane fusion protein
MRRRRHADKTGNVLQPAAPPPLWEAIARPVRLGLVALFTFVAAFGVWGVAAPIAGGAVAPGVISPDGKRRQVQHLEGGIIRKIHVRDGDVVEAGDPLVTLEDVKPRADRDILRDKKLTLSARRARLEAEARGDDVIRFPEDLTRAVEAPRLSEPRRAELRLIMEEQRRVFETRNEVHASRRQVLEARMEQLQDQVDGYNAQAASAEAQLELIADELEGKEKLWRKNLVAKPEILRLRRMTADIEGRRARYLAEVARAKERMGETRLEILSLDATRAEEVAAQLAEVRSELSSISEQLAASEDVLQRSVVKAPVTGTVVNMQYRTEGGVVAPGGHIMDIVPKEETLLIDAMVSPRDIDVVSPGLPAQVQLSAYSSRGLYRITGRVLTVSADRLVDEESGRPYYLARVMIDEGALEQQALDIELVPGMPAEVLIVTGERSFAEYLLEPMMDIIFASFREA